jgi:hypothetical protein
MEREEEYDSEIIIKSIMSASNKDSTAYKVTEYYHDLTNGILDDGGIIFVTSKILKIEKYLINWIRNHPNKDSTIMQPEESAIKLINDLRKKNIIK